MKKAFQVIPVATLLTATFLLAGLTHLTKIIAVPAEKTTGVIVPLYTDPPSTYWDKLIDVKTLHPQVPMIVIINPDNGPGNFINENYTAVIQKMKSTGIIVLGYIFTDLGKRDHTAVVKDVDKYKTWYNVNGILFDQMATAAGKEGYYKNLSDYAKSQGLSFTVGNPGTAIPESYVGIVDNMITYENAGLPILQSLDGWHLKYNKKEFSITSYDVVALNQSYVINASKYVGYIYISDRNLPNPWDSLPSYFNELVITLDRLPDR